MRECRDAAYLFVQATVTLDTANYLYEIGGDSRNYAAYSLALCAEFLLKAHILLNNGEFSGGHSHKRAVEDAGRSGVDVPRYYRRLTALMYEYESNGRYNSYLEVKDSEFSELRDVCVKFMELVEKEVIEQLVPSLRKWLPPAQTNMSDEELFQKYWRMLQQ